MQKFLNRLSIPLRVRWAPLDCDKCGEIIGNKLLIYDLSENEAWETLFHEALEWRLKEVTHVYQTLVNSFIAAFEQLAYLRKEKFLNDLPNVFDLISKARTQAKKR